MTRDDILKEVIDTRDYTVDEILDNEDLHNVITEEKVKDFIDSVETRVGEIKKLITSSLPDLSEIESLVSGLADDLY